MKMRPMEYIPHSKHFRDKLFEKEKRNNFRSNGHLIIFIVTRWQWLFYMSTKYEIGYLLTYSMEQSPS